MLGLNLFLNMYLLLSELQINGTIFQYCLSQNFLLTYVEFILVKIHMTGSVWKCPFHVSKNTQV